MRRSFFWLLASFCLQGLAACAVPDGEASSLTTTHSKQTLTEYHWLMQADFDPNRAPVQLTFRDQRLQVQGLCNNMGAGYTTEGQKMTIKQVVSTMRMCDDAALMDYEQRIGTLLEKVSGWTIAGVDTQRGPTLTLNFDGGQKWVMSGKRTHEAMYGQPVTLFLEVQPELAPCHHPLIADKTCLQTRTITYDAAGIKKDQGEWQLFYDDIEGYTHSPDTRNILRIKRYTRADVPADASAYVHVLDMVVESENVR